ncbi:GFA family protein [Pendulispora albinea]|uniref:GFA family protein n=1 Tax=Pendulispora albinea TaxID=2741071 RepID=A0ABZ2M0Q2_9BACT
MNLPMLGGCRCDRVRIRVTKAPLITTACHCNGCQRMSSSAFSLTALFPADAFEVTQGDPVIGGLHGPDAHHFFCAHCMTWMFTRPAALPHIVNVRPTMLDEHAWFAPFLETFTKTKLPWAVTGAVHSFEEFPPMEAYEALLQAFASHGAGTGSTS